MVIYSGFSYGTMWFSIAMFAYQRVTMGYFQWGNFNEPCMNITESWFFGGLRIPDAKHGAGTFTYRFGWFLRATVGKYCIHDGTRFPISHHTLTQEQVDPIKKPHWPAKEYRMSWNHLWFSGFWPSKLNVHSPFLIVIYCKANLLSYEELTLYTVRKLCFRIPAIIGTFTVACVGYSLIHVGVTRTSGYLLSVDHILIVLQCHSVWVDMYFTILAACCYHPRKLRTRCCWTTILSAGSVPQLLGPKYPTLLRHLQQFPYRKMPMYWWLTSTSETGFGGHPRSPLFFHHFNGPETSYDW